MTTTTTAQTTKRTGRHSGHSDKGNTWDGDDQDEDGTDDQDDGEDTRKDGNNEEENGNDKEDGNGEDSDNEGPARQRGEENETHDHPSHTRLYRTTELDGKWVDSATASNGVVGREPEVPVQGCTDGNQEGTRVCASPGGCPRVDDARLLGCMG